MIHSEVISLETERLLIRPLSFKQMLCYIKLDNSLEKQLGLNAYPRKLSNELKEALEQVVLPSIAAHHHNYLYNTLWTVIHKAKRVMIGDLCFKGSPNKKGEVEVGYGTYTDFQSNGFMTEALGALVRWAFDQPGVLSILAETDKYNYPSHKTLSKNGFSKYKEIDSMVWWRLDKSNRVDEVHVLPEISQQ